MVKVTTNGEPFGKWVMTIVPGNRGFMWFGTDDGLYRYHGDTLNPYRQDANIPGSLSDNTVKVIYKDRPGILWIGTGYGGLDRFDSERGVFTHYQHNPNYGRSLSEQAEPTDTIRCDIPVLSPP